MKTQPTMPQRLPFCVKLIGDKAMRAECANIWRRWAECRGLGITLTSTCATIRRK